MHCSHDRIARFRACFKLGYKLQVRSRFGFGNGGSTMKTFLPHTFCVLSMVGTLVGHQSLPLETKSSTRAQARPVADIPSTAEVVASRPSLDLIEGATVLVGAVSVSLGLKTFGTGFIVGHRGHAYVITCRHVIVAASSTKLFAIPRPQKTGSPRGGYAVLRLGKPIYHPKDETAGTYDIAALEIVDSTRRLRALGVVPLQLGPIGPEQPAEGVDLVEVGYPVDYAERELSIGKPEPMLPLRAGGTVRYVPLTALTQNGFGGPLREGYFAQTDEKPLGHGASGGAVYVTDGGHAIRVVGVILGSADIQVSDLGRAINITGFVFARSLRIIETLPSSGPLDPRRETRRRSARHEARS
jgi:Trypsin-like peptidase domain